jgi:hypothetical protein
MKRISAIMGLSAALALVVSSQSFAHHSFAQYDTTKTLTMAATVKELEWVQPHSWLDVMVTDDKGVANQWSLELGIMAGRGDGWDRKALKPGDKVTVHVHPLRAGGPGGQVVAVTLPDGKTYGKIPGPGGTPEAGGNAAPGQPAP